MVCVDAFPFARGGVIDNQHLVIDKVDKTELTCQTEKPPQCFIPVGAVGCACHALGHWAICSTCKATGCDSASEPEREVLHAVQDRAVSGGGGAGCVNAVGMGNAHPNTFFCTLLQEIGFHHVVVL